LIKRVLLQSQRIEKKERDGETKNDRFTTRDEIQIVTVSRDEKKDKRSSGDDDATRRADGAKDDETRNDQKKDDNADVNGDDGGSAETIIVGRVRIRTTCVGVILKVIPGVV